MRALVTGASNAGIGGAICRRLVRDARQRSDHIKIVVSATGARPELADLTKELADLGAEVEPVTGDLSEPAFPGRLVQEAVAFCGGLDIVISNAGVSRPMPLVELAVEEWDLLFAVHARAAWLLAKAAFPALSESEGALIATGSITGTFPHAGHSAYGPAKAALIMLCQTLAVEWGSAGIRVNVVSPGPVRTPISMKTYSDPERVERDRADRAKLVPLGRIADPEDVAGVVSFLAGPDAAMITGENIVLDGGLLRAGLERLHPRRGDNTLIPPAG